LYETILYFPSRTPFEQEIKIVIKGINRSFFIPLNIPIPSQSFSDSITLQIPINALGVPKLNNEDMPMI